MKSAFVNGLTQDSVLFVEAFFPIHTQLALEHVLEIAKDSRIAALGGAIGEVLEVSVAEALDALALVSQQNGGLERALLVKLALET